MVIQIKDKMADDPGKDADELLFMQEQEQDDKPVHEPYEGLEGDFPDEEDFHAGHEAEQQQFADDASSSDDVIVISSSESDRPACDDADSGSGSKRTGDMTEAEYLDYLNGELSDDGGQGQFGNAAG